MLSRCPICACPDVNDLGVTDAASIQRQYTQVFGSIPSQVVDMAPCTRLCCPRCNLEWFEPLNAGDDDFYAWIARRGLYPAHRWDFDAALAQVHSNSTILDIGAGSGSFAAIAAQQGHQVICVESSPAARDDLRAQGMEVHARLDDAIKSAGRPMVVTAFQVLEHVANPLEFASKLRLAATEAVIVSVPDARRIRFIDEPFDLPPHHLTRWSAKALETLLNLSGLRDVRLTSEPPGGRDRVLHLLRKYEKQMRFPHLTSNAMSARWGKDPRTIPSESPLPGHSLLGIGYAESSRTGNWSGSSTAETIEHGDGRGQ